MKTIRLLLLVIAMVASYTLAAQVAVNTDGSNPDATAMLDVKSIDKGMLMPRMTQTQLETIASPANGLIVYNTDDCKFYAYRDCSNNWIQIADGVATITPTFLCGSTFVDSRDGKSYTSVQIGTQCWMAENLNIGTIVNGENNQTNNGIIEKYCFEDNEDNCNVFGGLYQWDEMMQYLTTEGTQGICPAGWHLPTDSEWCTLENYVDTGTISCSTTGDRGTDVGGNLKETGTSHWDSPNTGATNLYGFTCLAGGYRHTNGIFLNVLENAFYWSSSETSYYAWMRGFYFDKAKVYRYATTQVQGYSVRCLKDSF